MQVVIGLSIGIVIALLFWRFFVQKKSDIVKRHENLIREADEVMDEAEKRREEVNEQLKSESKENIAHRFFSAFRRKPGRRG